MIGGDSQSGMHFFPKPHPTRVSSTARRTSHITHNDRTMAKTTPLASFKSNLQAAGLNPLADVFDLIAGRLAKVNWHIAHFAMTKPRDRTENDQALSKVEARFNGKIPAEIRSSLLDVYAICNGFSVVVGPVALPSPVARGAERDGWVDRPIGYELLPFPKMLKWLQQFAVDADTAPQYEEGGLRQLFNSDFKSGAKADTAAFRYSSYINLGDGNKLDWTNYCNESYAAHSVAIANDKFPGGYLGADGDQQPFLLLGKKRAPVQTPFAEMIAAEIQESLGHFLEAADVEEPPAPKRKR